MSEESKKPPVRIPEYRPHFAGWAAAKALLPSAEKPPVAETATLAMPADDFAAIGAAEAPPPSHGRRLWATPVLSAKPFAGKPALRGIIAPPDSSPRGSRGWRICLVGIAASASNRRIGGCGICSIDAVA